MTNSPTMTPNWVAAFFSLAKTALGLAFLAPQLRLRFSPLGKEVLHSPLLMLFFENIPLLMILGVDFVTRLQQIITTISLKKWNRIYFEFTDCNGKFFIFKNNFWLCAILNIWRIFKLVSCEYWFMIRMSYPISSGKDRPKPLKF